MVDTKDYLNTTAYPIQPRQPILGRGATSAEAREYADLLAQYELDMIAFREGRATYRALTNSLQAKLRADLEVEYEMVGHPKADLLWTKAWNAGHGTGLGDVIYHYGDLHELVA